MLVVTGLPTDANPGGRWWPDVGLGEGFLDPLPLVDGPVVDGPFRFALSGVTEGGWSFANDPTGSFTGMEARPLPVDADVVAGAHADAVDPAGGPLHPRARRPAARPGGPRHRAVLRRHAHRRRRGCAPVTS